MNLQILPPERDQGVRLGARHGYRIEGDVVFLEADLELSAQAGDASWALELWACEAPYHGGELRGARVARAELELPTPSAASPQHVQARADALLPAGAGEHVMVLVLLARGSSGTSRVSDFTNYPERERFLAPRFEGSVGYTIEEDRIVLSADSIANPRGAGNVSGALSVELWALAQPYAGETIDGSCVAAAAVPNISGQCYWAGLRQSVAFREPAAGRWQLTLMLREWTTGQGYVTRDYRNFALAYASEREREPARVEHLAPAPSAARTVRQLKRPQSARVSIQCGRVEDLARIEGLDLKIAQDIVKYRPYSSVDDLVKVRSLGPEALRRLKPLIRL